MAELVYALCALTSVACALLLWTSYRQQRMRLLLFSTLCFVGLAIGNGLLFVDLVIIADADLGMARHVVTLASLSVLLLGLVWDSR